MLHRRGAVDKVLIGGKLVVTGGRAVGIDRAALAAKAVCFAEGIEPIVSDYGRGFVTSLSHGADPHASE